MTDKIMLGMLFDLYGSLLTKKQYNIIDLHVNYDLSLGEISEQLRISRQGVYDYVSRARRQLVGYEEKLGLYSSLMETRALGAKALKYLAAGDAAGAGQCIQRMTER
ncbi:MAG: hypothetical protein R6W96_02825 [Clostridia bacterium]